MTESPARKAVIIAGNGPSLAKIDYRRFPLDAKVWRCNNFFLEDKYYVGHNVDRHYFTNDSPIMKNLYDYLLTFIKLDLNGEYFFNWGNIKFTVGKYNKEYLEFSTYKDVWGAYQEKRAANLSWLFPFVHFYEQALHSSPLKGVLLFIKALLEGYTDIYLTGMDGDYALGKYAWDAAKSPTAQGHDTHQQLHIIKTALRMGCANIYSLSEHSPVAKHIPLAPLLGETPVFMPEDKPETAIKQLLKSPYIPNAAKKAIFPKWLISILCVFVPSQKRRHQIRARYQRV